MEKIAENMLNVTLLPPRQKHPTIFARFDELAEGESLTIHNDHDPKPLYYQLLGERGSVFTWEYLEQGPEWWKVRISKKIAGEAEETLGQLAAADLRKAEIFKKFGLDYCCGGKKTLREACAEKGIDQTRVEQEIQLADKIVTVKPMPYNEWKLSFLADFIENNHHSYVRKQLPELMNYSAKVAEVHGEAHPELLIINSKIRSLNAELSAHLLKEEKVLFPYVKQLEAANANQLPLQAAHFGTVRNPINMMEMEHESAGELLSEIRELSRDYAIPSDACASYQLLFKLLQDFEDDLHTHIHLENNILFPKALEIEKALMN